MPNTTPVYHAFTIENNTLARRLISEVNVLYNGKNIKVIALWDTGATGTCVSEELAKNLFMTSTGKMNMSTPSGTKIVDTYLVDIALPNNVIIKDLKVCESDNIKKQGIDVLIGMDIILNGDFTVSNFNNKTVFTFITPSKRRTDYVKELTFENIIGPKHGKGKRKRK